MKLIKTFEQFTDEWKRVEPYMPEMATDSDEYKEENNNEEGEPVATKSANESAKKNESETENTSEKI